MNFMSSDLMKLINSMVNNSKTTSQIVYNKGAMQDVVHGLRQLADAATFTANSFQKLIIADNKSDNVSTLHNVRSYANVTSENHNLPSANFNNCFNLPNSSNINANLPQGNQNFPKSSFKNSNNSKDKLFNLSELAVLKNTRNTSAYAAQRNVMLAKIYDENLNKSPQRVPKKFAPTLNRNDAQAIREHKIKSCIYRVKEEIEKMKIHADIQNNKREKFEKLCIEYIERELNENMKQKLLNDYKNIIKKSDIALSKKLNAKIHFFNSNEYMLTINSTTKPDITTPQKTTSMQPSYSPESTDIDDVEEEEDEMPAGQPKNSALVKQAPSISAEPSFYCSQPDEHQLKRKADTLDSDTSISELNVAHVASTQPDRACKALVPFVLTSKNGVASNNRKKKKKKLCS